MDNWCSFYPDPDIESLMGVVVLILSTFGNEKMRVMPQGNNLVTLPCGNIYGWKELFYLY